MHSLRERCQQPIAELLLGGRYRYIDNGSNILAVAHVDSVTCGLTRFKQRKHIAYSTSLDDRLGVHVILDILPTLGILPDVLLTDDEEIGQSTAQEFVPHKQYNWMFQFDRRGQDAVHYEYNAMAPHIREFFTLGQGSFSDICWLEHLGCSGLNIGTGYYNEHTRNSYADLRHTAAQVERFQGFWNKLHNTAIPHTPYVPPKRKQTKDNFYDMCVDGLECSEYDRWARIMGYDDVDELVEWEGLPGRGAALDLIDEYIFGAEGFRKDWSTYSGDDDDDGFATYADYADLDARLF